MSHIVYQAEGIVLGEGSFGEADKALTVFTEDFGKIRAVAAGARYLKSKLRYNLGVFSYSRFILSISAISYLISIFMITMTPATFPLSQNPRVDIVIFASELTQARLAQSVEHQTFNLRVAGSSPSSGDENFDG